MITVIVGSPGHDPARFSFAEREILIGRSQGNHIVLPEINVSKRHARIVIKDGKVILVDLKSTNGTYVNGRKLTSPLVVTQTDRIAICEFELAFEALDSAQPANRLPPFLPRDRREAELLAQITAHEPASREIYADWLEEHGHAGEAEFVRAQDAVYAMAPEDPGFATRAARLRQIAKTVDGRWRMRIARPAIENCTREAVPKFDFKCPKEWGALEPTGKQGVRSCSACKQQVFYCASVPEARAHAAKGECVALDTNAIRWHRDLAEPAGRTCQSCNADVGSFQGYECPRCGDMIRHMVVGRMA